MSDHQNHNAPIHLGVLDDWSNVADTIALAEDADRLGYARYWLTEHPPQPNPQMIAALVAGVTETIRVGTAGILLNFHVPLVAAQQFLLLEQVFPGRIDAGFCGGAAPPLVAEALLDGRPDPRQILGGFEQRVETLIGFLRGELPTGHAYETLHPWPQATRSPEIWSFGTGLRSAELAARHGVAFGYSLFHNFSLNETASVDAYRAAFRPSPSQPEPLVSVSVAGVCAETECEASELGAESAVPRLPRHLRHPHRRRLPRLARPRRDRRPQHHYRRTPHRRRRRQRHARPSPGASAAHRADTGRSGR